MSNPNDWAPAPIVGGLDRGPDAMPRKIGHTCPTIDNLRRVLSRGLTYGPDRDRAFELLEQLRRDNLALRERAGWAERELKARKGGF